MLCNICLQIPAEWFFEEGKDRELWSHHRTLQELNASAETGCHLCRLLSDALDQRIIGYDPANLKGVEGKSEIRLRRFLDGIVVEYGDYEGVPLDFERDSYSGTSSSINTTMSGIC
jgi:hypothetical protein